jgi:hypothetical protein
VLNRAQLRVAGSRERIAFNAALAAATTALRASGYRAPTQPGHHLRSIDSLEYTINASPKTIQRLKSFSSKRNKSVYDVASVISEQELTEMIKIASELQNQVTAWLQNSHPELVKAIFKITRLGRQSTARDARRRLSLEAVHPASLRSLLMRPSRLRGTHGAMSSLSYDACYRFDRLGMVAGQGLFLGSLRASFLN